MEEHKYIPEEKVKEIQKATDIVELISNYIPLKKAGANYKALCPFHDEKTPSLIVNPEKQIYHCFGCHKGGNVFSWMMNYEKVEFPQAAQLLAERAGIKIEYSEAAEREHTKRGELLSLNALAARAYHNLLMDAPEGDAARNYLLNKRGFTEETLRKWQLGYAPAGWDFLTKRFRTELMLEVGLVLPKKEGSGHYDRFRNRIMFPIFDEQNRVRGFGSRALDEEDEPKYLNSPESVIFSKGASFYGINFAKDAVSKSGKILVVEGYTDAIMCHQFGLENVVALMGTSLTEHHAKKIQRYADELIVIMDSDAAGELANMNNSRIAMASDLEVKVMQLPEKKDPDDALKEEGKDKFLERMNSAQPLLEFVLDHYANKVCKGRDVNSLSIDEQKKALEDVIMFGDWGAGSAAGSIKTELWFKKASERLGISMNTVLHANRLYRPYKGTDSKSSLKPNHSVETLYTLAFNVINCLVRNSEYRKHYAIELSPSDFPDSVSRAAFGCIVQSENHKLGKERSLFDSNIETTLPAEMMAYAQANGFEITEGDAKNFVERIKNTDFDRQPSRLISQLKSEKFRQDTEILNEQINAARAKGDTQLLKDSLLEYNKLTRSSL